jgi:hypothetical protein
LAPKKSDFYAPFMSGAHRLPNGNTSICSGPDGTILEVTPDQQVAWKYVNPVKGGSGPPGLGLGGSAPSNQVSPWFLQDRLGLSAEQKKEVDALQKTVDETLNKVLTDAQRKTLRERSGFGLVGFAAMPAPGQVMSLSTQVALKPTPEQKTQLSDLQKSVDARLDKILTDDQKQELKQRTAEFARGPGGGLPADPPRGPGGPGGGPPPFGGPPGGAGVFRAYKYAPGYPGLAGKDLKPGKTVEELQSEAPERTKDSAKAKETDSR